MIAKQLPENKIVITLTKVKLNRVTGNCKVLWVHKYYISCLFRGLDIAKIAARTCLGLVVNRGARAAIYGYTLAGNHGSQWRAEKQYGTCNVFRFDQSAQRYVSRSKA